MSLPGLAACALSTIVAIPLLLSGGSSDGGQVITADAAITTSSSAPDETDSSLLDDVDVDGLFAAGAVDDSDGEAVTTEPVPTASQSETLESPTLQAAPSRPDSSRFASEVGDDTSEPTIVVSTTEPPLIAAPTTEVTPADTAPAPTEPAPTETAPPETAPPETAAPETAPPETAPPEADAPAEEADPAPEAAPEETGPREPTADEWAALRQCESGNNYSIVSSNGRYHGAYQFGIATWDGTARSAGRADLVGVAPSVASPADQDAMAYALWSQRGSAPWPHCGKHLPPGP